MIAEVEWDNPDVPARVNVKNLCPLTLLFETWRIATHRGVVMFADLPRLIEQGYTIRMSYNAKNERVIVSAAIRNRSYGSVELDASQHLSLGCACTF